MTQSRITVIPARQRVGTQKKTAEKPKVRVAAYCRVSTDSDEQATSYEAQIEHYTDFIQQKQDWTLAGIYADDGISGTNTKKREEFNRMIEDCMAGNIDMIITKSISRFARNTLDCLKYIRQLKDKNISVFFEKERIAALNRRANVYVINRENVEWLVAHGRWEFDMVVIDELSSFKSHKARRFKSLKKVRPMVKRIVGLTGTPAPNGLIDLWAEIGILDMGQRLGCFIGGYRERFFVPDKWSRVMVFSYKPREGAEEAIYGLISDICISMKAVDYLEMPDCIYNRVEAAMSEKEMELYRRLERDMLLPYEDGDIDAVNAAGLSNKLMQMANGAVYDENGTVKYIHDRKLETLEDLVEAANGKPVLVAYWYKHDLARIRERIGTVELDTAEDFQKWNAGEIPVAVIHPVSAGHGLNLQAGGSTLIWFGLTWSLELYQQMNARLWRQGQKCGILKEYHTRM